LCLSGQTTENWDQVCSCICGQNGRLFSTPCKIEVFHRILVDPGSTKTLIRRPWRFIDWADERISANVCGREAQTVSG